jgi:N6-adenosine-specific RNA methylase IME4/transposase-like protein
MSGAGNLFPALDGATEAALRDSIQRFGVLVPVAKDQHGNLLDGFHRSRLADELGTKYRVDVISVADEDEAREIARTLNADRRQMTAEQRREIVVALREAGHSTYAIAGAVGASQPTVRRDLARESHDSPEESLGRDGKRYPARRPPVIAAKDEREAQRAQRALAELPELPDELVVDVDQVLRARKEHTRDQQREQNREMVRQATRLAAVGERFGAIVLDPPWDWGDEGDADQLGRARPTYATMPFKEIAAQPIDAVAQDNAHLYLWITNRSLPKGFELLERWGFRYVTALTWVKPSIGMGNYFRGSTEHILFGVRGSLPLLRADVGTHFHAPRPPQHSQKPDEFYALVESCSPGPWLEWPARRRRDGWVVSGAEIVP